MRKEIPTESVEIQYSCDICLKQVEHEYDGSHLEACRICEKDMCRKCQSFGRAPPDNQPYSSSYLCVNCVKDFNPWLMQLQQNLKDFQEKDREIRKEYADAITRLYPHKKFII